ncbi:MAG TPA: beta-1,6-N-acetylglucosaminyltransferase [Acidimicrobiia bacterium]|nr:beta-1,6-N-acetylglucosaminyltransferase [Acidimicrobiia bacterium]
MRLLFLITAYGQQDQLRRLCATLRRLDSACLISVQFDESDEPFRDDLASLGVQAYRTKHDVRWGDGSYLDELLRSLERSLAQSWQWLVLLSGQDYPLRPIDALQDHLSTRNAMGMLWSELVPPPGPRATWTELQRRYWFQHWWVPAWLWRAGGGSVVVGRALRLLLAAPGLRRRLYFRSRPAGESGGVGRLASRTPFTTDRPCRKGADYFALRRELVTELVASARSDSALLDYFRRTAVPSEAWFHTVLGASQGEALLPELLHFTRFEGGARPRSQVESDFDEAQGSGRFFARKFDASSQTLLDRIDAQLLGLPSAPRS